MIEYFIIGALVSWVVFVFCRKFIGVKKGWENV